MLALVESIKPFSFTVSLLLKVVQVLFVEDHFLDLTLWKQCTRVETTFPVAGCVHRSEIILSWWIDILPGYQEVKDLVKGWIAGAVALKISILNG